MTEKSIKENRIKYKTKYSLSDGILVGFFLVLLMTVICIVQYQRLDPSIIADELGYITAAKLLSGRLFYTMQGATFYHFGYAIFLVPASWITDNPDFLYRLFMAVNGLFVIAQFILLQHIGQTLFSLSRKIALLAAFALTLCFPFILQAGNVWTPVCAGFFYTFLLWVFITTYRQNQAAWRYIACGALTAFMFTIHPSTIGIVLVGLVIPVIWAWRNKSIKASFSLAGLIPIFLLTQRMNRWVLQLAYSDRDSGASLSSGNFQHYLDRITSVGSLLKSFSGQLINSFISSGGLFFVGVFALVFYLIKLIKSKKLWTWQGVSALFFFFSSLSVYVLSIVSMTNTPRWDHLFYGRYVDIMMPAYIFLAIIFIVRYGKQHKIFLAVTVPLLFAGLNGVLYFLEKDALLRLRNVWRNDLGMTIMSYLLPSKNFGWLILFGWLEYALLIGGALLLEKGIALAVQKYKAKKAGLTSREITLSDEKTRIIVAICVMFSIINILAIGIVNIRFAPSQRTVIPESQETGALSRFSVQDFISGKVVIYSQEAFKRGTKNYYTLQYRYNCQFRFLSEIKAHNGEQYYMTDQKEWPTLLFGSWVKPTDSNSFLYYFPDFSLLQAQIEGLDVNNSMIQPVHISNFSYTLPEQDKYARVTIGKNWNSFDEDFGPLELTLFINGTDLPLAKQVEDSYYFLLPDNVKMVTTIDITSNFFSDAAFDVSTDTAKMGVSIAHIDTTATIE